MIECENKHTAYNEAV